MTKVKICGITTLEDARMCVELGVDALGFVFAPSRRHIDPRHAREIVQALPPMVTTVGVFMDAPHDEICALIEYTGIDVVQLHGRETHEYCAGIPARVIKRIPVNDNICSDGIRSVIARYRVSAFILDPGAGDGEVFDWQIAAGIDAPLIIAGGLTSQNVRRVVDLVHPYGVDVSSGVEEKPGKKAYQKVKDFVKEVRIC